ncbi:flagellar hook capping FlgD N-terminal domain-containing protein [Hyphomonas sp.]|uniref:flagellar hook assembly protein FlgD n=1 Tax=Hyphomonas sp. TaxID=87 RepID=UPI000C5A0867|nr:flagellar hook capping FlgD N-terminal domain-containing protein [Hyphomonas sp.]MAB12254.1 flagellar biosynthesis protein FlgD [Hyphomonas sp.]MAU68627.1 flagellar biosynthesis protein FlgD [Hyphomonas sp.]MBM59768.1 flagellar biosynthesis protein FlgD [Hyphomonas sp.]
MSDVSGTTTQSIGKEFNSFIKLLTAQIRNQDPLSPMDSTQFVDQLATFSTLEQQVTSNTHLEGIASMIGGLHSSILAGQWLGETVAIDTSWAPYSGEGVDLVVDIPESTDETILKVRDADGNEIWSKTLDPEASTYTWNGETSTGDQMAEDGVYQLEIQMYKDGELQRTTSPRLIGTVTGVTVDENGTLLLETSLNLTTEMANVEKYDR